MSFKKLPKDVDGFLIGITLSNGDVHVSFRRPTDVEGTGEDAERALLNLRERLADHIVSINDALNMMKGH